MRELDGNISTSKEQIAAIDAMIARIERFKTSKLDEAAKERELGKPDFSLDDDAILETMISAIAYSNQARADLVGVLFENRVFNEAFENYSVERAAALTPDAILDGYWTKMGAIRQRRKVKSMIDCATFLASNQQQHGSFMEFLHKTGLPVRIESQQDINGFWKSFDQIRDRLGKWNVPYFSSFISLCYLLMELGFDCLKPDSAVMTAAVRLGIVPETPYQKKDPTKRANHPETSLRRAVEAIQSYAVLKGKRTPVIDLYLLILANQTGVQGYVDPAYYTGRAVGVA